VSLVTTLTGITGGSLCHTFQKTADWVWQQIGNADRHGLAFSEETITETILLELKAEHPAEVSLCAFTKREEKKNGADWEWWIGRPGRWLGMRVQAKRVALPREEFKRLQTYGSRKGAPSQLDVLIASAARDRLNAAYCLYVHSKKWPTLGAWPLFRPSPVNSLSPKGCLIADARAVKASRSNALSKIAPVALPWHLLVCQCASTKGDLADAAMAILRGSLDLAGGPAEADLIRPVEELPRHMTILREALESEGEAPREELREIARKRRLLGFLLIEEKRG
jgi:hypothetical protein